jgi:hypothetical protein
LLRTMSKRRPPQRRRRESPRQHLDRMMERFLRAVKQCASTPGPRAMSRVEGDGRRLVIAAQRFLPQDCQALADLREQIRAVESGLRRLCDDYAANVRGAGTRG